MKKITVIITTFNNSQKAILSLQSLLSQSVQTFDIIIVDDFSMDLHYEKLQEECLRHGIKLIQTDKNSGGPSIPRNKGVASSQGDYFAFLDAGDIWLPHHFESSRELLELGYPLVYSDYFVSNYKKRVSVKCPHIIDTKVMNKKCYIGICTVFVKREYFLPFRNTPMHEDYCLWLEILSTVPAIKTNTSPSCIHYRDPGSRSSRILKNIISIYSIYKILKYNFVFLRTIRYVYLGILERLRIKILMIGLIKSE